MTVTVAFIASISPLIKSLALTPTTRLPLRMRDSALTRVAMTAPWRAAVRATESVCRASSTWASKYLIAPMMMSGRSDGAISLICF
ncbi:unannotated protein [freshwater metagenome]|uniref:Unannotated protein n=1 Tax=freshwater metagenome TaxID=449393 RepID=A0A6J7SIT7_9ZZZZ